MDKSEDEKDYQVLKDFEYIKEATKKKGKEKKKEPKKD